MQISKKFHQILKATELKNPSTLEVFSKKNIFYIVCSGSYFVN